VKATNFVLGATVVTVIASAVAWHHRPEPPHDATNIADATFIEGKAAGMKLDEVSCVRSAMARHEANTARSVDSSIRNGLWVAGCLVTSTARPDFCDQVPREGTDVGKWTVTACTFHGLSDPYCPAMFISVVQYCGSTARNEKLKGAIGA
jgi:hypothetical protein